MSFNIVPDDDIAGKFLRKEDVARVVPFHHATIRRMVKNGTFPAPVKMGGILYWNGNAIMRFLLNMAKESNYVEPSSV
jgi:predicted DNA-binding transcriptional regulator AlpA